jgi:hypothetical protein
MEVPMRSFALAMVAAACLATAAAYTLNSFQTSIAQAMTTGSARFNQLETVNIYGREG